MTLRAPTPHEIASRNKAVATRYIEAFNHDDWEAVPDVVAPGFVFHHPMGGTVAAGPDGMAAVWAGFKRLSPDSWHPIPVMIAEGDHVAVLLPTYGHFTGTSETGPPPTGGRLDYGMVNMVRLDDGMIVETWFGMDPLVEMQQLGLAPPAEPRPVTPTERANLDTFAATKTAEPGTYDNVVAFGDVIVAMGPPQDRADTVERRLELYRIDGDRVTLSYRCASSTKPPYGGDPGADTEAGRAVVGRWTDEVLSGHDPGALDDLTSPHVLVHPTAMPCEAGFYGRDGTRRWLEAHWTAFPDLVIADSFTIAHGDIAASRWTARGTSRGEFMGLPPTGGVVEFTGVTMYRIEDDLIAEIWDTRNTLGILGTLDPGLGAGHHHHHH